MFLAIVWPWFCGSDGQTLDLSLLPDLDSSDCEFELPGDLVVSRFWLEVTEVGI